MFKVKPFLKWAGGKGQLLEKFHNLYPLALKNNQIETYIEPFIGGGAVFFDIIQKYQIKNAILIDINKELINCYKCIKEDVNTLIKKLIILKNDYLNLDNDERALLYYSIRKKYNAIKLNGKYDFDKAADFIFLNKTCYNGLYRVNSKGEFNVPHGKYKHPEIFDENNLLIISKYLQNATIKHSNYNECINCINNNTFVYLDPPYRPLIKTNSFVNYNKNGFDDKEQIELAKMYKYLDKRGSYIMLSNSDPKNVDENDDFFDNLYQDYKIDRLHAKRMINCQSHKRGNITEIVVRNYCNN